VSEKLFEPGELREILFCLSEETPDLILVGGQAVNFWAVRYYEDSEPWNALQPYASEDIDFLGSRKDVEKIALALGGAVTVNLNRSFDASPQAGVVLVEHNGQQLRIDVLANVFGISEQDIIDEAFNFIGEEELQGVKLKVIDPVLALESKLKCLLRLPQGGRQDLKHTRICVMVLNAFLQEYLADLTDKKMLLAIVEHVFSVAVSESGLFAWLQHSIEIEQGIPLDMLEASRVEKIQRFNEIRKPQLIKHLHLKRQEYKAQWERRGGNSASTGF
jgi:hypothetical protein